MQKVLIVERSREIRDLLALLVGQCGHLPVFGEGAADESDVALALVEPSDPGALELAEALRERNPALPLVFVSIEPPSARTSALAPAAHVEKPFALQRLRTVLVAALPHLDDCTI